jgi:hypothetical protein
MIFNFDTDDHSMATAALLVYAIYRSRDKKRFKVSPEMWGQIDRFTKGAAKRATSISRFIDSLMPRMHCPSINPKWMEVGIKGGLLARENTLGIKEYMEFKTDDSREFLTQVVNASDHTDVINKLYQETQWVILLVRERLEREKPVESSFDIPEESL